MIPRVPRFMTLLLSFALVPALVGLFALAGCEDDEPGMVELDPPSTDLTGTWDIQENADGTACGDGMYVDTFTAAVTQTGNDLTVVINGETFTGTISGTTVRWSGSFPDDGGTTTTNLLLTVSGDGNSLTGNSTWSWTDGVDSCEGSSVIAGQKRP